MPPPRTRILSSVVNDVRRDRTRRAMAIGAGALLLVVLLAAALGSRAEPGTRRLAAAVTKSDKPRGATLRFGSGPDDAILAIGPGWSVEKGVLARNSGESGPREPRAYVTTAKLELKDAAIEADVELDEPTGALGDRPPSVELVMYKDEQTYLGVRLALAEDAGAELFLRAPPKSARTAVAPRNAFTPVAGRRYHLELFIINGKVTSFVDGKPLADTLLPGMDGVRAQVALGCVGQCRFSNLKLRGVVTEPAASAER